MFFPLSYISSVFSLWSGERDGDIYKEGQHYILMRRYLVRLHAYPNSQDWKVYYPSYVIPEDERIPSSEVYWKESYWSIQIREWWISFSRHNLRNGTSLPRNISYTRSISARSTWHTPNQIWDHQPFLDLKIFFSETAESQVVFFQNLKKFW